MALILMLIVALWSACALAVIVMFAVDERAHRRSASATSQHEPSRPVPSANPSLIAS